MNLTYFLTMSHFAPNYLLDVCHLSILTSGGYEDDEDVLLAQKDVIQKNKIKSAFFRV